MVRLIQSYTGKRAAAVGDGGNDVSMIQAADAGSLNTIKIKCSRLIFRKIRIKEIDWIEIKYYYHSLI